jgi:prolyl-tRNA synthetase
VIVPIFKGADTQEALVAKCKELKAALLKLDVRVKLDDDDKQTPGWKFAEYELKGVPLRIAIGPRDLTNGTCELVRRDLKLKTNEQLEGLAATIPALLEQIQDSLYQKALAFRDAGVNKADTMEEFNALLDNQGGFVSAHWDGTSETELAIKDLTKATIRCLPLDVETEEGTCIFTGKPSARRVLFARAY